MGYFSFEATSLVILKYGSWSIAQGIRQAMSPLGPNICGKVLEKEGAAWIETKCNFPILSLSLKPKHDLDWFAVMALEIFTTFL